jgi:hypothetical protein
MAMRAGMLDVANTTATSYSPEAVSANKDRVWMVVLTIPILLKSVFFINTCFDSICYIIKLTQLYPWAQGAKLSQEQAPADYNVEFAPSQKLHRTTRLCHAD